FVPAAQSPTGQPVVYLGCYVTEGPSGLAWVDLDGKKLGGKKWVGGNWTAAPFLARDAGPKAVPGVYVYVGSTWETEKQSRIGELRITALTKDGDKPVVKETRDEFKIEGRGDESFNQLGGLAVYNGVAVVSLRKNNLLLVIDLSTGKTVATVPLDAPRGVAFDSAGRLLAISGTKVVRYDG